MKKKKALLILTTIIAMACAVGIARVKGFAGDTRTDATPQPEIRDGGETVARVAGRGNPWINLADGLSQTTLSPVGARLSSALAGGQARPLALASADFDRDGIQGVTACLQTPYTRTRASA